MKILLADKFGHHEIVESNFVPRLGDKVARFYQPYPTVTLVLCWPTGDLLRQYDQVSGASDLDAIVLVD